MSTQRDYDREDAEMARAENAADERAADTDEVVDHTNFPEASRVGDLRDWNWPRGYGGY